MASISVFKGILLTGLKESKCYYTTRAKHITKVGNKFKSIHDINDFLEENKWDGEDLLNGDKTLINKKSAKPNDELVFKLLKLSGLSREGADIEKIKEILTHQIQFIDILQKIPLTAEELHYDTNYSRLLPRNSKRLTYDDLIRISKEQKNNKQESEVSGDWNPISTATKSENNHFIIENGLLKNRK